MRTTLEPHTSRSQWKLKNTLRGTLNPQRIGGQLLGALALRGLHATQNEAGGRTPAIAGEGRRLLDGLPAMRLEPVRSVTSPAGYLLLDYRPLPGRAESSPEQKDVARGIRGPGRW